ncbi:hypothetical protein CAPTEDRAFT_185406 [Capitella teleta]|uniref:Uncharacterized protein n=1 Tax=Capitella teleta TaxID=283909 RepID=R7VCE9_CAPTE|nr:hypothetical protein CAPTEDRAFT_185406 [Capitella teleta]|eukprot:ELU13991.1 hypothetical protein CAPTEDRAFT_185406 [Capitella teleta]
MMAAGRRAWSPSATGDRDDYDKFLQYLHTTIDDQIAQKIRVYDLEDIKKKPDESIIELVDRIRQMARLAEIGDNSDKAIEFEVQRRLIRAIPDSDIALRKELLKVQRDKMNE